jgi:hypothetical protein
MPIVCVELLIGDLRVRPDVTILRVKSKMGKRNFKCVDYAC